MGELSFAGPLLGLHARLGGGYVRQFSPKRKYVAAAMKAFSEARFGYMCMSKYTNMCIYVYIFICGIDFRVRGLRLLWARRISWIGNLQLKCMTYIPMDP